MQCQSCGTFDPDKKCPHCNAPMCAKCIAGHEQVCKVNTEMKKRGMGPTVTSAPVRVITIPPDLQEK